MADAGGMTLLSTTFRAAVAVPLPGEADLEVAVEIIAPEAGADIAFVCLPGGAMTKRYYDLHAPGTTSFSFAAQMAARGFACVLIDPLGIGDSARPVDSYALTAEVIAVANAQATAAALEKVRNGSAVPGLPPRPRLRSIGLGHSMGAMLTVLQQAQARQHAAIAVLGFSTRGLPEYLSAEALALDPARARREAPRLARALFGADYPVIGRTAEGAALYAGDKAESLGVEAVKAARAPLLPVPAYQSMLPGNVAAEAAVIDVPVFVALGEHDIAGPPAEALKAFGASRDVRLHVLPNAGHSHFLFASRVGLFDALAQWADPAVHS